MATSTAERGPSLGITVLIAGAGVGGLMAALECWRRGCDVRILERSPTTQTQGDSFTIGTSALAGFKHWPAMLEEFHRTAYRPLMAFHDVTGARLRGPIEFSALVGDARTDEETKKLWVRSSRPKFHALLLHQVERCGLKVEYGKPVVDYFEDADAGQAGVVVDGGERLEADLVIAADGLRGASYKLVKGEPVPARASGEALFRVAYPVEYAMKDPEVAERWKLREDGRSVIEMWVGPNMHVTFWRNEDTFQWAVGHPDIGTAEESWNHHVTNDDVLAFATTIPGWPEIATRAIRTTPPNTIVDWRLMWRDPQPTWTSPAGHVIQLGDAGHTFLPTSGNGGTQAIEDAISLATCLALAPKTTENKPIIPTATRTHNLLRFERVSCLQAFGVQNRENLNTKSKHGGSHTKVHMGSWILQHNPEQYAIENFEAARAHLETGAPFRNTNLPPGMVYRPWTIDGLLDAQAKGEPTVLDGDWQ